MYKLEVLLESLYRVHIVKLNLYIDKYSMFVGVLDMYKLEVLLKSL